MSVTKKIYALNKQHDCRTISIDSVLDAYPELSNEDIKGPSLIRNDEYVTIKDGAYKLLEALGSPVLVLKSPCVLVLSGKFKHTRYYYRRKLSKIGINVADNVTKKTSYLILGERPGHSKTQKAKSYGIKSYAADEFYKALENAGIEP